MTILLLNPGSVLTERIARGRTEIAGMIPVRLSVSGMIEQIDKATLADTGRFLNHDGTTAPW